MESAPHSPRIAELADMLWYERRLLEFLLFKLVSANLVLSSDDRRFVNPAVAEVERVMQEVRKVEQQREDLIAALADEWGVRAGDVSLEFLAANGPEELRGDFADHRGAFHELVADIEDLTRENRRLATVGLEGIRGTINVIEGAGTEATYDSRGHARTDHRLPSRVDRVL